MEKKKDHFIRNWHRSCCRRVAPMDLLSNNLGKDYEALWSSPNSTPVPFARGTVRERNVHDRGDAANALDYQMYGSLMFVAAVLDDMETDDLQLTLLLQDAEDAEDDSAQRGGDVDMLDFFLESSIVDDVLCGIFTEVLRPPVHTQRPMTMLRMHVHRRRRIIDYAPGECRDKLRFAQLDLQRLFRALNFPRNLRGKHGHIYEGEELFLLLLRKYTHDETFVSLESEFGRSNEQLCEGFAAVKLYINYAYGHLVNGLQPAPPSWSHPTGLLRWESQVAEWHRGVLHAVRVSQLPAVFGHVCCFLDGTFRPMSRPGSTGPIWDIQRVFYTRYKKGHGLTWQILSAPNGMIIDIFGPVPARHNDLYLVHASNLNARLDALLCVMCAPRSRLLLSPPSLLPLSPAPLTSCLPSHSLSLSTHTQCGSRSTPHCVWRLYLHCIQRDCRRGSWDQPPCCYPALEWEAQQSADEC